MAHGKNYDESEYDESELSQEEDSEVSQEKMTRQVAVHVTCLLVDEKARDPFWDNLKGALQYCVVITHVGIALQFFGEFRTNYLSITGKLREGFLTVIFLITMPGYVVISGFFSNPDMNSKRIVMQGRYFLAFLIQHFFICLIMIPQDYQAEINAYEKAHPYGKHPPGYMPIQWFATAGPVWFLLALVVWRCVLPLLARLSSPLVVSVCFALAMMMTDVTKSVYSNAPCMYLPFFVLGYKLKSRADELTQLRQSCKIRAAFIVAACVLWLSRQISEIPQEAVMTALGCIYGGSIRDGIHMSIGKNKMVWSLPPCYSPESPLCQQPIGVLSVCGFYVASSLLIIGFMTLVPGREVWLLTKAGVNSLYIYLCHFYFAVIPVILIASTIVAQYGAVPIAYSLISLLFFSFLVWACMAGEWVKCICWTCVEPPYEKCCFEDGGDEHDALKYFKPLGRHKSNPP